MIWSRSGHTTNALGAVTPVKILMRQKAVALRDPKRSRFGCAKSATSGTRQRDVPKDARRRARNKKGE